MAINLVQFFLGMKLALLSAVISGLKYALCLSFLRLLVLITNVHVF